MDMSIQPAKRTQLQADVGKERTGLRRRLTFREVYITQNKGCASTLTLYSLYTHSKLLPKYMKAQLLSQQAQTNINHQDKSIGPAFRSH